MKYEYHPQPPSFTVEHIDILNVTRGKNYRHSYRNGRLKHGFIYVVKGAMRDTFLSENGEEDIRVDAGELIFVPKGSAYVGTYLELETQIRIVQFDLSAGTLPSYFFTPKKIGLPNASELIGAFFQPVKSRAEDHPFYFLSCLYRLLWQIDMLYSGIPTKYKKLQAATSEIAAHYDRNEPISHYAELCGMSEVNFRRLFREYTQRSPIEYRNGIRLENARILLQSGEYNVSEAAEAVGFSNLSFFIRLYKKKYGYTPKKE